jgi:hypothetical protein
MIPKQPTEPIFTPTAPPVTPTPAVPETAFCGDLRSKRFFMLDRLPTQASDFLDSSGVCWCYHTQQAIGPDGGHATPHECVPGRRCYRSALADPT